MNDCDFIPTSYHGQQTLRRSVKLHAWCIVGLLVIMAVWFAVHQGRIASAEAMLVEAELQKDQVCVHADKQQRMASERAQLDTRRRLLDELADRDSLVLVLSDLSRRMPERVILTQLSVRCPSVSRFVVEADTAMNKPSAGRRPRAETASDEASQRDDLTCPRLEMSGIAVSLPDMIRFAGAMEESALVQRVDMKVKGPTVWSGRRAEQFTLTCELAAQDRDRP